jgi:hypothetical protein
MSTLIKNAAKKLNIQHVYLSASSLAFYNDFDPLVPNQLLTGQYMINTVSVDEKIVTDTETKTTQKFLRCYVQAGMRYLLGEPTEEELKNEELVKSRVASEITAVYCVIYSINPEVKLTEEEKEEFGKTNVPYHVWTYWREYVQNTCNRMNLPVTTVPMLVIDVAPKKEDNKQA